MAHYDKPHITYQEQLELLKSRGLQVLDDAAALNALRAIGYYRFSGYLYPFRELMEPHEIQALPEVERSPRKFRHDSIRVGVTFDHVLALWKFDRELRGVILDGADLLETALRAQVAYILGARDPFGHLHRESLDEPSCSKRITRGGVKREAFSSWIHGYGKAAAHAANDDFARHFKARYAGSQFPIWIASEFLEFGHLLALVRLLKREDRNRVGRAFGFTSGDLLAASMTSCKGLRNTCAHFSRTWNRAVPSKPPAKPPIASDSDLVGWGKLDHSRVYSVCLLMAVMIRNINPQSAWPQRFRELLLRFPPVPYVGVEDTGAPSGWSDLPVWKDEPRWGRESPS